MAKPRPIAGLESEQPYAAVAARVVEIRAAELLGNAPGVLDTEEIERVHDMRVATRRLRAALEVFEPCFPHKRFKPALREVKALADALGERRDRDVTIASLVSFAEGIGRPDRPGIESLIARQRDEQEEANQALAPHVTEERLATLSERIGELVAEARALVPAGAEPPPAGAERLQRAAADNGAGAAAAPGEAE